jgi:hypothetical protein
VVAVGQYADWSALAKVRLDPEFAQFLETMRNYPNPASAVYEEVVL